MLWHWKKQAAFPGFPGCRERCMPAGMMATPPCCLGRQPCFPNLRPKERYILYFSLQKKGEAGQREWWKKDYSRKSPVIPFSGFTTCRVLKPIKLQLPPVRNWLLQIVGWLSLKAKAPMEPSPIWEAIASRHPDIF